MKKSLNLYLFILNMTKINRIVLFFTLAGVSLLGVWFLRNVSMQKPGTTYQSNVVSDECFLYQTNFRLNTKMRGQTALDISCEKSGKKLSLSELVQNGPVLVYRYSDVNCSACVENEFHSLRQYFKKNTDKVAILCSYERESDIAGFRRTNLLKYPIYKAEMKAFSWDADLYDRPYYFILYPDMKVSDFYIPAMEFPEESKEYLAGVERLIAGS